MIKYPDKNDLNNDHFKDWFSKLYEEFWKALEKLAFRMDAWRNGIYRTETSQKIGF